MDEKLLENKTNKYYYMEKLRSSEFLIGKHIEMTKKNINIGIHNDGKVKSIAKVNEAIRTRSKE
jgi:outer membrane protein assembly factor BamE (lipoprotein component of BamABCDE complex)